MGPTATLGASSAPVPVEIVLKANGGELECTVIDDKGTAVPEANVTLVPNPPRRSRAALYATCITDASGKCTLLGVAPGDHKSTEITVVQADDQQ